MKRTNDEPRATRLKTASPATIAEAARILLAGGLVVFPTETVYGLGADAQQDDAIAALYAAKGRPSVNPLIAHVLDVDAAGRQGALAAAARSLAEAFWPGPLTLVVPVAESCTVSRLARAGLDTVALRAPAHPVARALLEQAGRPIVAPSANRSGRVSPTRADHALTDLGGRVDFILDGGQSLIGVESTIVLCVGGETRLLRPGGIAREKIEDVLRQRLALTEEADEALLAPGMLASHYAPRADLRLNALEARDGEAVLDFAGRLSGGAPRLELSATGDLTEAAANLFACLRGLDASGAAVIAVAAIPSEGMGEAINDRLRRAAAPR